MYTPQAGRRPRRPAVWKVAVACVGVAVAWQLAIGLAGQMRWRTAVARWGTLKQESRVRAVIVRDERVHRAAKDGRLFLVVAEGQRVARGEVVAFLAQRDLPPEVYDRLSEYCYMARQAAGTMIQQVQAVENELDRRRQSEEEARLALELLPPEATAAEANAAKSRWEEAGTLRLETERRLQSLAAEQAAARTARATLESDLLKQAGHLMDVFYAEESGIVSASFDGYEDLLTPETLRSGGVPLPKQTSYRRTVDGADVSAGEPLFRLVNNYQLLLAVPIGPGAANVSLPAGRTVRVTLAEGETPDPGSIIHATGSVIVISLNRFPPDCLEKRVLTVRLEWSRESGVIVPCSAVVTRKGHAGVIVDRGRIKEFRPVTVLAQNRRNAVVEGIAPGTLVRW